jgi:hypothetical protein
MVKFIEPNLFVLILNPFGFEPLVPSWKISFGIYQFIHSQLFWKGHNMKG